MISEDKIIRLVEEKLEGTGKFLVCLKVKPSNKIQIFIDDEKGGLDVSECVALSRYIESHFDRNTEDFELEVSSPGLDTPFRVFKQYMKNKGTQVSVITKEGNKHVGKLIAVEETGIVIEKTKRERTAISKKKKELIIEQINLSFQEVKETSKVIAFN